MRPEEAAMWAAKCIMKLDWCVGYELGTDENNKWLDLAQDFAKLATNDPIINAADIVRLMNWADIHGKDM